MSFRDTFFSKLDSSLLVVALPVAPSNAKSSSTHLLSPAYLYPLNELNISPPVASLRADGYSEAQILHILDRDTELLSKPIMRDSGGLIEGVEKNKPYFTGNLIVLY
jgi:hypothetical protein